MVVERILITGQGRKIGVSDLSKDFHTQFGFIKKSDLKKKSGSVVTSTGEKMMIMEPSFIDRFSRIKRGAQIMILKEIGSIIAYTGLGKNSKVLDAGAGSGALACFMGNIVKEVVTYEINDRHMEIVQENIKNLGLKNVKLKKGDICTEIKEKGFDVVTLDIPNPQDAVASVEKALKSGGFLVSYSPNMTQVQALMLELQKHENLVIEKSIEIMEREWEVHDRICRPKFGDIGHTGFLVFVRKINK